MCQMEIEIPFIIYCYNFFYYLNCLKDYNFSPVLIKRWKIVRFILSNYIEKAIAKAQYDKLDDDSYAGRIPVCLGVVAFGKTLKECEDELRSALEDWIYLGLRQGHRLPILQGINLNRKIRRESMESL